MKERWKDIKGYEGIYQISNMARVKSLGREQRVKLNNNITSAFRPEKIIKVSINTDGYLTLCLTKNYFKKTVKIHRLVAIHFIKNKYNKPYVNHKDGNKLNNSIENLEWCTYQENLKHAMMHGLRANHERHGAAKLTKKEARLIRELRYSNKMKYKDLSEMFNVAQGTIQSILHNRTWQNI